MDTSVIDQRENKMINFMDEINKTVQAKKASDAYENSPEVKRRVLEKTKKNAKGVCLDMIFSKIYKDALPLNDEYKVAHGEDLDGEFKDFVKAKAPQGLEYYVHESIKKGNTSGKLLLESVNKLVKDFFFEMDMDIENVNIDDIKFDPDSEKVQERITEITDKMGAEDISEIIKNNVKTAALEDINRSKAHDEEMKAIVDELKNDPSVTTEAVLDRKLNLAGVTNSKIYTPTLFEGIMINKTNLVKESGMDIDPEDVSKKAFTESVKEMTKLTTLHTLGVQPIGLKESKALAFNYAGMNVPESKISIYNESVERDGGDKMLREQRLDMYLESEEELFEEGANLEIRRRFKKYRGSIKKSCRKVAKLITQKQYDEAQSEIKNLKKMLDKVSKEVDAVDADSIGSLIFSFFTGDIMFIGRSLTTCIPKVGPFIRLAVDIDRIIKRIKVIIEDVKKRGELDIEDFNLYRNGIKVRIKEYQSICDAYSKIIDEAKKSEE